MTQEQFAVKIRTDTLIGEKLGRLYGNDVEAVLLQRDRYAGLLERHMQAFGEKEGTGLFSAPGRTEIGGNHTDHNHGRVLAAAVNLDTVCAASPREDLTVHFLSEGYEPITLSLDRLDPLPGEQGTTAALIRGVAAGMADAGYRIGGFDATVTSTVAGGSGLSSSAALEIMLTGVFDGLFNTFSMTFVQRAQIGKKAENIYFGKPSGLLDQMASAAGGIVTVDFADPAEPKVEALQYDFAQKGFVLAVVGTGGSHANLTDHYAAIPAEMKQIASFFGQETLRGITTEQIREHAGELRKQFSDRAVLRAIHFTEENDRVPMQVAALKEDRMTDFLQLIIDSGRSSFMYLQNVFADNADQSLSTALCLAETMLKGKGAWRVHGGGFAGTTLNFVPAGEIGRFIQVMDGAFGKGATHVLNIRPVGADCIFAPEA